MRKAIKILLIIFIPLIILAAGVLGFLGIRSIMIGHMRGNNGPVILGEMRGPKRSMIINKQLNINTDNDSQTYENFLTDAVAANRITSAQKDLISAERTVIQNSINEINNQQLTATQRNNEIQKLKDSIYTWSSANNIPLSYLGLSGMIGVDMMGMY
jgi:hypothetical protein